MTDQRTGLCGGPGQVRHGPWRRALVRLLSFTLSIAIGASQAAAADPKKVARVGYLAAVSETADAPRFDAFRQGLLELGYVEGRNLVIERRHSGPDLDRLRAQAAELIGLRIDVLIAVTTNAALAAKQTTSTTPIVFMGVTDPVAAGLVTSLARPGGNSTGITNMAAELSGKRLELLKQAIPGLARVAVLWDPMAPGSVPQWKESQLPAQKLNLRLHSMEVSNVERYEAAFRDAARARSAAVWVTLNPLANSNQKLIADLAINSRLPSICARADYAENGCMIAYGPSYALEGRQGARYADRILRGALPTDLPIEQPTTFELVINLATARRLGVSLPPSLLQQADRLVE